MATGPAPSHAVGVDGCGAPAVAVPLAALARAFAPSGVGRTRPPACVTPASPTRCSSVDRSGARRRARAGRRLGAARCRRGREARRGGGARRRLARRRRPCGRRGGEGARRVDARRGDRARRAARGEGVVPAARGRGRPAVAAPRRTVRRRRAGARRWRSLGCEDTRELVTKVPPARAGPPAAGHDCDLRWLVPGRTCDHGTHPSRPCVPSERPGTSPAATEGTAA
jgi:hypothetical protein